MTVRNRRLSLIAAIVVGVFGAGTAVACETIEFLPGGEAKGLQIYDAGAPVTRYEMVRHSKPSTNVNAFLRYVHGMYLPKARMGVYELRSADMARLLGYAIGEAATHPAPINMFTPEFRAELETWIARLSAYDNYYPPDSAVEHANNMWRLVEEGARGFYDEEIRNALDSFNSDAGPTSVEKWFKTLSPSEQQKFLNRAARAGLAREDGERYSIAEFEAISILLDGQLERENVSDEVRRAHIRDLAAGIFTTSNGE